jgi:hypothetical protein
MSGGACCPMWKSVPRSAEDEGDDPGVAPGPDGPALLAMGVPAGSPPLDDAPAEADADGEADARPDELIVGSGEADAKPDEPAGDDEADGEGKPANGVGVGGAIATSGPKATTAATRTIAETEPASSPELTTRRFDIGHEGTSRMPGGLVPSPEGGAS